MVRTLNQLLVAMSNDMAIDRYYDESEDDFTYRLCYSALGQWCLRIAQNTDNISIGTTKHNQTLVLNELLQHYLRVFPAIADRYIDKGRDQDSFSVHIRRVFEETGYLLTDSTNRVQIANFGRSILIGNCALFFGIPDVAYSVNGLGVFRSPIEYKVTIRDFLIRDDLTWEEFFYSQYDLIDFSCRDLNIGDLEFFDPLSSNVPSKSWRQDLKTDFSVARKSEFGPFYKVFRMSDGVIQFAEEPIEPQKDSFTSNEFRRLYFALKAYYKNPIKAIVERKDANYSKIRLRGFLPNREYLFLLLLSWPINNAFNRVSFVIKTEFIPDLINVFTNLGVEIYGGE